MSSSLTEFDLMELAELLEIKGSLFPTPNMKSNLSSSWLVKVSEEHLGPLLQRGQSSATWKLLMASVQKATSCCLQLHLLVSNLSICKVEW